MEDSSLGDKTDNIFLDPLPEYLKCPICLCCLDNPYQVSSINLSRCLVYNSTFGLKVWPICRSIELVLLLSAEREECL